MEEMVELLAQYQWVYNFKLTRFFADRVWERIPEQWNEVLLNMSLEEMNSLPIGSVKEAWPASFKQFVTKCMDHSLPREQTLDITSGATRVTPLDPSALGTDIQRGMSQKKLHEVCHMTGLIDHVTRMAGTQHVVDVGSGLGYLGQALHKCYGHQVLGLEGKQCHTTGAEKRSTQTVKCSGLQNVQCELHRNTESRAEFLAVLQDWFKSLPPDGSQCAHWTGSKKTSQNGSQRDAKKSGKKCKIGSNSDTSQNQSRRTADAVTADTSPHMDGIHFGRQDLISDSTNVANQDFKDSCEIKSKGSVVTSGNSDTGVIASGNTCNYLSCTCYNSERKQTYQCLCEGTHSLTHHLIVI